MNTSYFSPPVGLTYDTINKNLGTEVKKEGLHNGPPGFEFIIFPSVYKTLSFSNLRVRLYRHIVAMVLPLFFITNLFLVYIIHYILSLFKLEQSDGSRNKFVMKKGSNIVYPISYMVHTNVYCFPGCQSSL